MRKKDKDLENLIDTLTKENNTLKKKISKFRKIANNSITFDDVEDLEDFQESSNDLKNMPKKCSKCGGEFKKVKVVNMLFAICQKCKNRIKIK